MKLAYSLASPFARKIRIAAIELGLYDKIEFVSPIKAIPVTPNEEYAKNVNPLRKIPALILDSGRSSSIPTSSSNISMNSPAAN